MTQNQIITSKRISIIDFLRGFALIGVVVSNFMSFQSFEVKELGVNQFLTWMERIAFGPQWITLSFLFGFGFWALINQKKNSYWSFTQRMFWLLIIGFINACLFRLDILRDFAVVGICLLATPYFNKKHLLWIAVILTISIPLLRAYIHGFGYKFDDLNEVSDLGLINNFKDLIKFNFSYVYIAQIKNSIYLISVHYEMFCFFLWGILASRWGIFEDEFKIIKSARISLIISITGILTVMIINLINAEFIQKINSIYNIKILTEILYAMMIYGLAISIYSISLFDKIWKSIEIYGRMTLSNYLFQSIFSILLFSGIGLGLGTDKPLWIYFLIAAITYIFQLIMSIYWSKKYLFGPAEWLWRSLSARKVLPILKKSA